MSNNNEEKSRFEELVEWRLNRRSFMSRAVALGISVPAFAGLLAACGGDDDDDDDDDDVVDEVEDEVEPTATEAAEDTEDEEEEPTEEEMGEEEEEEPTEAEEDEEEPTEAEEEDEEEPTEAEEEEQPEGEGNYGGRLVIANTGQPTSFDYHQTAGGRTVQMVGCHIYEHLFTWDAEYGLSPQLAESFEANDEATMFTINLRQGVSFHNGEEMVANDVITTINRWAELSPTGALLFESVDEIVEVDDYTIEIALASPLGTVPQLLARAGQGAAIMPASILDAAGTDFVDEYIGTGPYVFTDFQADRFTLLTRFEDYTQPPGEASGYAGARMAYLDELEFVPVPDEAARVAGFQAGDYHYLEEVVADQIEQMREDPNLVVETLPPRSYGYIGINHNSDIFSDLNVRKAAQACMNVEPQGLASHGEGFFELGPGIMLPVTVWDSDAGSEFYNMNDPELSQQLLDEAGYDGTPVVWITTQDDLGDYNSAVVCQQQLEAGGFTVELEVLDEATLATRRNEETGWDVWNGAFILRTDPTLLPYLSQCDYSGFWCSDPKEEAFQQLLTQTDFDARYEAFETLQTLFYEEVGGIKQQDNYGIMTIAAVVQNFGPDTTLFELEPEFTNCWLEDA